MKKRLLLMAADIVENANPLKFNMGHLETCILGTVASHAGFEKLREGLKDLYRSRGPLDTVLDYESLAAKFFDIPVELAIKLFRYDAKHQTPLEAAVALRKVVVDQIKREKESADAYVSLKQRLTQNFKKPRAHAGMAVLEKAVKEILAVPARVRSKIGS